MGFNLSHIKLQKRLVCLLENSFCQTSVVHGCVSLWSPSGLKAKRFASAATNLNVSSLSPRLLNSDSNEHCNFNCTTFKQKKKKDVFKRVWFLFVYMTLLSLALCKYFERKKDLNMHIHTNAQRSITCSISLKFLKENVCLCICGNRNVIFTYGFWNFK